MKQEYDRQKLFERQQISHRRKITFGRLLLLALFLFFWERGARTGRIDVFFFSSPTRILALLGSMCADKSIFGHIAITLMETIISFVLVFFISLLLASLLWFSAGFSELAEPYLVILNSLPKSALAPLIIVWLGTGTKTIIVAGISVAIFGSVISFYTAFQQCDPEKITLIRTLGGNQKDIFSKVVLPSSVPLLLSAMKVNIGLALVGVIIGEFLAAKKGLGYLIIYGSQVFQLNLVIMNIILLCLIAMGLYKIVQMIEYRIRKKMQI